jgi:hypothetical protein
MRRKRKPTVKEKIQLVSALRAKQLGHLFVGRYGRTGEVPADKVIKDLIFFVCCALYLKKPMRGDDDGLNWTTLEAWIARWGAAEWMPDNTEAIMHRALRKMREGGGPWSGEHIAKVLKITAAERRAYKLWTMGAIDETLEQRKANMAKAKRERDCERQQKKREDAGQMARSVYQASSKSALQPWKAEGVSKSTWQRRQRALPEAERWQRPTRPEPAPIRDPSPSRVLLLVDRATHLGHQHAKQSKRAAAPDQQSLKASGVGPGPRGGQPPAKPLETHHARKPRNDARAAFVRDGLASTKARPLS